PARDPAAHNGRGLVVTRKPAAPTPAIAAEPLASRIEAVSGKCAEAPGARVVVPVIALTILTSLVPPIAVIPIPDVAVAERAISDRSLVVATIPVFAIAVFAVARFPVAVVAVPVVPGEQVLCRFMPAPLSRRVTGGGRRKRTGLTRGGLGARSDL